MIELQAAMEGIMSIFSGFKLGNAIALGVEILGDVEQLMAGIATTFSFTWKGQTFVVSISQPQAPQTPPAPGKP